MTARARCARCGGTGVVIEYRLVWKMPRDGWRPLQYARRVPDFSEGWLQADELPACAFDVDVLSGARDCKCRAPEKKPEPEMPAVDYKSRQAGDFD